jgi:hypothetical protein
MRSIVQTKRVIRWTWTARWTAYGLIASVLEISSSVTMVGVCLVAVCVTLKTTVWMDPMSCTVVSFCALLSKGLVQTVGCVLMRRNGLMVLRTVQMLLMKVYKQVKNAQDMNAMIIHAFPPIGSMMAFLIVLMLKMKKTLYCRKPLGTLNGLVTQQTLCHVQAVLESVMDQSSDVFTILIPMVTSIHAVMLVI